MQFTINKLPIPIKGTIFTSICFESLPRALNGQINLEVLRKNGFKENLIIIGRDFMENHGITVVTEPLAKSRRNNLS